MEESAAPPGVLQVGKKRALQPERVELTAALPASRPKEEAAVRRSPPYAETALLRSFRCTCEETGIPLQSMLEEKAMVRWLPCEGTAQPWSTRRAATVMLRRRPREGKAKWRHSPRQMQAVREC